MAEEISDQKAACLEIIQKLLLTGQLPEKLPVEMQENETFQLILDEIYQLQQFALELSNGNLQPELKMKGRAAGALKALQANLRHLTWQTQTIAGGDFSQQVDFMGDFSSAFNTMVSRLREQRVILEQRAAELTTSRSEALRLMHEAENARHEAENAYASLQTKMIEISALQAQLQEQAIRDPLTTCFNRRYMDETLQREFARAAREQYSLCLVMADIDHFKKVNDTYGHSAGDFVLQVFGLELRDSTRTGDMVCRYGGEEFLAVMPNIELETAVSRANYWREKMETMPVNIDDLTIHVTVSMGVACFPRHGGTIEEVLRAADEALYKAKNSGRNRVCTPADCLP